MDAINSLKMLISHRRSPQHPTGPPRRTFDIGAPRPDRRMRRSIRWPALILLAILAAGCAVQGPSGPTPSQAPQPRPAQQPTRPVGVVPPSARNAVGEALIHTVKPGEILSKIAMRYYGSYLTEVFYLPARNAFVTSRIAGRISGKRIRIGIVTDLIEQINGFAADNLYAGQKIRLPQIEGLPFLGDKDQPQTTTAPAPAPESPLTPPPSPETRPSIPTPPPAPPEPTPDTVHLTLLKGIDAFNAEDYSTATDHLQEVLKKRPRHSVARHYLARTFYQKGLAAKKAGEALPAIESFRAALDYDPDCFECEQTLTKLETQFKEIHYKNGIRYFEKEELDKAIAEWEMVYRLDPDYENVRKNIELARRLLKKLEEMEQKQ